MMAQIPVIAPSHVTATTNGTEITHHAPTNPGATTSDFNSSCQPMPVMIPAAATTTDSTMPGHGWRSRGVASRKGTHQGHSARGSTSTVPSRASWSEASSPDRAAS